MVHGLIPPRALSAGATSFFASIDATRNPYLACTRIVVPHTRSPLILILFAVILLVAPMRARAQAEPEDLSGLPMELVRREADLIHLINLTRRENGVPPLRWNRELSEAVRWFAVDSVDGGTGPTCDHEDSLQHGPGTRMREFGYNNPAGYAQLLVCGFAEPAGVVHGWLHDSADNYYQKQLLLNPAFREIGAGYYLNRMINPPRGLVAVHLAADNSFAPVIINNEAPSADSSLVSLYIYPTAQTPVEIKVSNNGTFTGAEWEPYVAEKVWQLAEGTGWRTVHVLTRDVAGKTSVASDTIFVGGAPPAEELSLDHATNIGVGYALAALPAQAGQRVRFSMNWDVDSGDPGLLVYRGEGESVQDEAAIGGSALLLRGSSNGAAAHATLTNVPTSYLLTAYFRLKAASNSSANEVARIVVMADGRQFGPLEIRGNDFDSAQEWQEFGVNFVIPQDALNSDVSVYIARSGETDIWLDVVRIFSQAHAVTPGLVWSLPGMNERSQGIQARFDDGNTLGEVFDVAHSPVDSNSIPESSVPAVDSNTANLLFTSSHGNVRGQNQVVLVCGSVCLAGNWTAQSSAPWLHFIKAHEGVLVYVDATDLPDGNYEGKIAFAPLQSVTTEHDTTAPAAPQTWVAARLTVNGALQTVPNDLVSVTWLPITTN